MKNRFLSILMLMMLCALPRACGFDRGAAVVTVISITDGDTVIVAHGGKPEKVRLLDIDSPEKSQAYGRAAKRFLSDLVFMREVRIERRGRDKYGRTLATLYLADGTDINAELLRNGCAWLYKAKGGGNSLYKNLMRDARNAQLGLWAEASPIAPWDYRKARGTREQKSDMSSIIRQLLGERDTKK